ncbi:dihydroxy-acid dehydratase [Colwellia sp. E2M01]|uniref:dihydroxy-acid dehydratase domain-containing protein n=1 Tax=Colwellia sp. E2M01 TaxID=2841561 RepID=UPI00339D4464
MVFEDQHEIEVAFKNGELDKDFIAVVKFQGPKARGMPELHKLIPPLAVLQDKGYKVALVTDGRMSGASGNVPAPIHLSPETLYGGIIAKINNGDLINLNCEIGHLTLLVDEQVLAKRSSAQSPLEQHHVGMGRVLFGFMRNNLRSADTGACSLFKK